MGKSWLDTNSKERNRDMDRKKRGIYIHDEMGENFVGVAKKIADQMSVFEQCFDMSEINIKKEKTNIVKSILWRLPFGSYGREYGQIFSELDGDIDFFYIRFVPVDRNFIKLIRQLKERYPDSRILLEIPTFPYGKELLKNVSMFPFYFKDIFYRRKLKKNVYKIVTFSEDEFIFGIPTIKTMNGIMVEEQRMIQNDKEDDIIRLVAVAMFQKSHGYERCIKGLANYYKREERPRRIELHMVGEGSELKFYKKLTTKYHLEEYVIFYGKKIGKELETILDKTDIALGCFGLYKRKIKKISSLKVGEYLARGIPVITGCKERAFEENNIKYLYEFSNDKQSINMDNVVKFYDSIYNTGESRETICHKIREYAQQTVDMELVMQPIVQCLEGKI